MSFCHFPSLKFHISLTNWWVLGIKGYSLCASISFCLRSSSSSYLLAKSSSSSSSDEEFQSSVSWLLIWRDQYSWCNQSSTNPQPEEQTQCTDLNITITYAANREVSLHVMCDCKGRAVAHLFCTTLETGVCGVSDHAWGLPPTREYLSVRETNCSQTAVIADYERCSSELMWLTFPASLRKGLATLFCCRSVMRLTNLKHNHTCYSSKVKFNLICMVQVHLMDDGW